MLQMKSEKIHRLNINNRFKTVYYLNMVEKRDVKASKRDEF